MFVALPPPFFGGVTPLEVRLGAAAAAAAGSRHRHSPLHAFLLSPGVNELQRSC